MARAAYSDDDRWLLHALEPGLNSSLTATRLQLGWKMQRHLDLMEQRRKAKETDDGL